MAPEVLSPSANQSHFELSNVLPQLPTNELAIPCALSPRGNRRGGRDRGHTTREGPDQGTDQHRTDIHWESLPARCRSQATPDSHSPSGRETSRLQQLRIGERGIDVQSESITLSLTPKNEHAPQISGNISLTAAPGTAEDAAIEEFMTYGRPLTLDASNIAAFEVDVPFSVQDLIPAESSPEQIIIGPAAGSEPMRQLARIDAVNGAGRVLGSLAVTFTEASEGPRGGLYRAGHDRSGFLRMAIKVSPDRSGGQIEYQSEFMDDLLPADVLPSLRFLDAMRRSSMLRLVANGSTTPIRIPDAASRMARIENLLHMAEAFDRISQTVGIVLPLPKRWSDDDATNVTFYDRLLREGTAPYPPADFHFTMPAEQARALLGRGPLPRLTMTGQGDRMPELLGHELPLPGKMEFESQGLLVANLPHLATQCAADPPPDTVDVVLVSDLTTTSVFRIVPDTEQ